MVDPVVKAELEKLRPHDPVTIIDGDGARLSGTVMQRRLGIDPPDELILRRANMTVTFVKHSRIASIERGM